MSIALKNYEKGRYQEHLENEQLHSIIKEVREKINNYTTRFDVLNYQISDLTKKELLEILDKENKENENSNKE